MNDKNKLNEISLHDKNIDGYKEKFVKVIDFKNNILIINFDGVKIQMSNINTINTNSDGNIKVFYKGKIRTPCFRIKL